MVHHDGRPAITSDAEHNFTPATIKHEDRGNGNGHTISDEKIPGGGRVDA